MVRKLENGNIVIGYDSIEEMNEGNIDGLVNGDFFWNDLSIEFNEDIPYLVDYNRQLAYNLYYHVGYGFGGILKLLHQVIASNKNEFELRVSVSGQEFIDMFCKEDE